MDIKRLSIFSLNLIFRRSTVEPIKVTTDPDPVVDTFDNVDNAAQFENITVNQKDVERKKFKKCHGKCVQKFCLPISELSVYEACSDKCKNICNQ